CHSRLNDPPRRIGRASSVICASAAALALAFSNQLWTQSTMAEVYSLNAFFTALILYLLLLPTPYFLLPVFLFGLGMGNHHTMLLLIPAILYLLLTNHSSIKLSNSPKRSVDPNSPGLSYSLTLLLSALALGFSIYLFLLLRSQQNPIADWDNPENLTNFFKVVFRSGYGGVMNIDEKSGMFMRPLGLLISQMADYFKNMIDSFTIFGFILGILGFTSMYKKDRKALWFLFIIFIFTGPVFIFLANKPLIDVARDQLEPFYIPSITVFAIWIGYGIKLLIDLSHNKQGLPRIAPKGRWFGALVPGTYVFIIVIILFQFSSAFPRNNLRNNFASLDIGRNILKTVPENSLLFLDKSDESIFILAYQKIIEKRKPTVDIIDCNASVFPNIYGDRYYWIKGKERRMARYPIERKMIIDAGRKNIYYLSQNPNYFNDIKFHNIGLLHTIDKTKLRYNYPEMYALRENNLRLRDTIMIYVFYMNLADYYTATRQTEKAISMYKKAITIKPEYTDAYYNLAGLYWNKNNWRGVIEQLEKLLELQPGNTEIQRLLDAARRKLK
ncbi:MAG: DUF2723 domain-containing protein, partial [Elusimicrobia bacterium]|nr:DUF2723 domain-containing protein [Elusimicrobiota bacterium]